MEMLRGLGGRRGRWLAGVALAAGVSAVPERGWAREAGRTTGVRGATVHAAAGRMPARVSGRGPVRVRVLTPWEQAERGRDQLEAQPEGTRTRDGFAKAMDGFRAIYHADPRDMHAAEAVNAVAELLAEQGRELRDAKSLQAAVGQYEFLRQQYPGSSLRVGALLAEGQIQANDLHDAKAARAAYGTLLTLYPKSGLAEEARVGLRALAGHGAGSKEGLGQAHGSDGGAVASSGHPESMGHPDGVGQVPTEQRAAVETVALPPPRVSVRRGGPMAVVTGIRHWSTPSYTRVAIDLGNDPPGGEVTYEAARVPGPDRIFFDLHGAKLGGELQGKSFAVTDDGFLKRIRAAQANADVTRVVLDVNDVTEYSAFLLPNPYRLIIDIHGKPKAATAVQMASVDAPAPKAAGVPNTRAMRGNAAEVKELPEQPGKVAATAGPTTGPVLATVAGRTRVGDDAGAAKAGHPAGLGADARVVGDPTPAVTERAVAAEVRAGKKGSRGATAADARVVGVPARAAERTADGQTSLVRALGLKINRIVIDAGHGGHDSGTIGAGGIQEKDVVLDVALRLGKLLQDRLGAEVIYTRSDDTFIPLETRTAIANKAQADLFLSIHANSSPDSSARGVETYYLNFTQQAESLQVAARENAVSGQSIHELSDLVRKITLTDKLAESREFATDVEGSLYAGLARGNDGLKNRGVKKAPFVVLIGANMPSVLAEISFVTNPKDAAELRQGAYKERVAESLYKGVARYVGSLSSTGPAAAPVERASRQ